MYSELTKDWKNFLKDITRQEVHCSEFEGDSSEESTNFTNSMKVSKSGLKGNNQDETR